MIFDKKLEIKGMVCLRHHAKALKNKALAFDNIIFSFSMI